MTIAKQLKRYICLTRVQRYLPRDVGSTGQRGLAPSLPSGHGGWRGRKRSGKCLFTESKGTKRTPDWCHSVTSEEFVKNNILYQVLVSIKNLKILWMFAVGIKGIVFGVSRQNQVFIGFVCVVFVLWSFLFLFFKNQAIWIFLRMSESRGSGGNRPSFLDHGGERGQAGANTIGKMSFHGEKIIRKSRKKKKKKGIIYLFLDVQTM